MGLLHYDQGQYEAAEPYFREAVGGDRSLYGDSHPDTLNAYFGMITTLVLSNQLEEAEKLASHCYPLHQKIYGNESQETRLIVASLALLYEKWNKPEQAKHYRDILDGNADTAIQTDNALPSLDH